MSESPSKQLVPRGIKTTATAESHRNDTPAPSEFFELDYGVLFKDLVAAQAHRGVPRARRPWPSQVARGSRVRP